MKISTSIVIQKLFMEQIGQLEADIAAYQTTFKDAPRAAEAVAYISKERDELLAAKEDFCTLPCGMLDIAHILTYDASTDDIKKAFKQQAKEDIQQLRQQATERLSQYLE